MAINSDLSESDCDGQAFEEDGYFETWHVYADQTVLVVLDAQSEFDSLMELLLVTGFTDESITGEIIGENDDRAADDTRALMSATFDEGQDYLLRLSGFNEQETGRYTIRVTEDPNPPLPPPTGSVQVRVSSTGQAPVNLTATLNGAKAKPIPPNGTAQYADIVTGDYAVELTNLGDCKVNGGNRQDVVVNVDQTATATFDLSCTECITADDCPQPGVCTVTVCAEGGNCDTQTAEDGASCDYNGDPGQCTGSTCEATACDPPCTDDDLNDCTEPFCPESSTVCDTRSRPADSDCQRNGGDGKCNGDGTCDICVGVDCTTTNECKKDSTCNSTTGTCNPFENEPDWTSCSAGNCLAGTCRATYRCTEQGIRDAIAKGGGGRYTFDCGSPTTVVTQAEIVINNGVILDGEGKLTVDGNDDHRVLSVVSGITAELVGMTISGGYDSGGGGILNEGTLTITNSIVESNREADRPQTVGGGGGIFNSGTLAVVNSVVRDNRAFSFEGSGIYSTGTMMLNTSGVSGNSGFESSVYSIGTLTLIDSYVSDNGAADDDAIKASGTLTLINSAVVNNDVYVGVTASGTMTVINSTVDGGRNQWPAIAHRDGTLTLINSTIGLFNPNSANLFGTINSSKMVVSNSLVLGSNVSDIGGPTCSIGSVTSRGGNIESPTNDCGLTPPTDLVGVTASALNLGPLADHGGPTMTYSLLIPSVAIDRVPVPMCVDPDGNPLTTDQRGQPRPAGLACDAGAFEVQQ